MPASPRTVRPFARLLASLACYRVVADRTRLSTEHASALMSFFAALRRSRDLRNPLTVNPQQRKVLNIIDQAGIFAFLSLSFRMIT